MLRGDDDRTSGRCHVSRLKRSEVGVLLLAQERVFGSDGLLAGPLIILLLLLHLAFDLIE